MGQQDKPGMGDKAFQRMGGESAHQRVQPSDDDVEGHAMQRAHQRDDDVEGHAMQRAHQRDDDVEGHVMQRAHQRDEDDVEGHQAQR